MTDLAEIRERAKQDDVSRDVHALLAHIDRLEAEAEITGVNVQAMQNEIADLEAENERLREKVFAWESFHLGIGRKPPEVAALRKGGER